MVLEMRAQSSSSSWPVRMRVWSTRDSDASIRIMIWLPGISRLKISTGFSCVIAACSHRFMGESGFTHRRTGGDDDQVRFLQTGGFLVEILIAGVYPGNAVVRLLIQLLDTRNGVFQNTLDAFRAFIFTGAIFRDLEYPRFGQVEQIFAAAALRIITGVGDLVGYRDHFAHDRSFTHDVGISTDVGGTWGVFRQLGQIGETAHRIQFAALLGAIRTG
ncbi:Uncharacterised protein [Serratia plymuthica]|uniref:Uncharacterized protein n=1 Tax=Serratia plymuthica TaxID=82996 RepID=A0A2X4YBS7_SERPL|nr:Uncharacterised protein [Serratia plymuthica]